MSAAARIYGYAVCFLCILIAFGSLALLASTAGSWRRTAKWSLPTDTMSTETMSTDTAMAPEGLTLDQRLENVRRLELQEEKRRYEEEKRRYEEARSKLLREADYVEVAAYASIFLLALITFGFHWRWLQRVGA